MGRKGQTNTPIEILFSTEDQDLAQVVWRQQTATVLLGRLNNRNVCPRKAVLSRMLGRPLEKGERVRHTDGDILNCRRENLQLGTEMVSMLGYQKKMVEAYKAGIRAAWVRYGAGKARTALELCRLDAEGMHFIFAPNHVCDEWRQQTAQWWPEAHIIDHNIERAGWSPYHKAVVSIIPHSKLKTDCGTVAGTLASLSRTVASTVIFDESTAVKNPKTNTFKNMDILCRKHWSEATKLVLSGDPMPESETEIWGQFQIAYGILNPFGQSYYAFLRRWFVRGEYTYALKLELREEFQAIIDRYSYRLDEEDFKEYEKRVPTRPKYEIVQTTMSQEQQALITQLHKKWTLPNGEGTGDTEFEWSMQIMQKELQISDGFYYRDLQEPVYLDMIPKAVSLQFVINQAINSGHNKIAVWHRYQADEQIISAYVGQVANHNIEVVPGDAAGLEYIRNYTGDRPTVIIMQCSKAKGINDLLGVDVAIIYSNAYSQEIRNQLEARHSRLGSKHMVTHIFDLTTLNMRDSDVVAALQSKDLTSARLKAIVSKPSIFVEEEEEVANES